MGDAIDIRIIGALEHAPDRARDIAARLLRSPGISLSHGGEFTGKPVTEIHADDAHVLKANRNRVFGTSQVAEAWCAKRLESERQYGIYHPERTWLVIRGSHDRWQAANLSPRLTPLHTLAWDKGRAAELLPEVLGMYIRFAARFDQRLDEGLSNFGMDRHGRVFYLDDDIFAWDEHLSFVAMISRWLRAHAAEWFDAEVAGLIGTSIRETLHECRSSFDVEIVAEALKDQYLGERAESAKQALLQSLLPVSEKKKLSPA